MSLLARLDSDIKDAMRAKAMDRLGVLRMLKSSIKAYAIEKGLADDAVDEPSSLSIVRKELKKRQDSVEAFEKGGRVDLAEKEKAEAVVLSAYLPQPLTPEEVTQYVKFRLLTMGRFTELFTGAALQALHAHSHGVPRTLNKIAMLSLIEGALQQKELIDEHLVGDAAKRL